MRDGARVAEAVTRLHNRLGWADGPADPAAIYSSQRVSGATEPQFDGHPIEPMAEGEHAWWRWPASDHGTAGLGESADLGTTKPVGRRLDLPASVVNEAADFGPLRRLANPGSGEWRAAQSSGGWRADQGGEEWRADQGGEERADQGGEVRRADQGGEERRASVDTEERLAALRAGLAPPVDGPIWTAVARLRELALNHIKVVALIGLVAVIATVYLVLRARTWVAEAEPMIEATWLTSPTPVSATPAEPDWRVHVLGAVQAPGIVLVPPQSRVADAIAAAGGLTDQADPGELNLAAELSDGCQLIIGTIGSPRGEVRVGYGEVAGSAGSAGAGTAGTTGQSSLIDLNQATSALLETLPGVGPVTAGNILAWREQHGRFTSVAELQEVNGIGPKTYAQIAPYVRV